MTKKKAKSETLSKREEALLTLLKLIAERGIQDAPMSMVAERSGIAIGTIYHHFKSKEEMVEALYGMLKEKMGKAIDQGIRNDMTIKEQFFTYWHNLYRFYSKNPDVFYFLEQCDKHPVVSEKAKEENLVHYAHIFAFLADGMKKDVLREMDVNTMMSFIYGTVVSTVHGVLTGRIKKHKTAVESICQSCWDGTRIN